MFESFPKIARLNRNIVITEKIDGTNAQIHIVRSPSIDYEHYYKIMDRVIWRMNTPEGQLLMFAGSRNRYVTPDDDNFGFAKWVKAHAVELFALGQGRHYGEWYGRGIQHGYGLSEKRFALFNVGRWNNETPPPACCSPVPVLYQGPFSSSAIHTVMYDLFEFGTHVPGCSAVGAEGIIIYHEASRTYFKRTFEHDQTGKPE